MNLIKNPFIRITGVIIILYFGLFSNTHHNDSLGNRLSKENLKKDLTEVKQKSAKIVSEVQIAREYQNNPRPNNQEIPNAVSSNSVSNIGKNIIIKDVVNGKGEILACGDLANIEYKSFSNNDPVGPLTKQQITVGKDNFNSLIQNNIIGMKKGGVRLIILVNSNQAINYEVTLLDLKKNPSAEKCNL